APERSGAMEFISFLRKKGVVVSMGHSSAEYETAVEAIERGVTSSTHTFNAMKLFHMHRPAISGAALESDEVYAEIISDGFHLHPASVRLILKTKGLGKVVAITDSIMAAGLPDGFYKLGVNDVVVSGGDAKLKNGVRAGSTLTLDKALRNLMAFTGRGPEELWHLLSGNQADMLGQKDRGEIVVGKRADLVVLDDKYEVIETIKNGKTVYRRNI
ncbi:MAG: N-acetylglucosamine-6-phosphate deacetylase, partial [Candidatus Ornithospirochaeta sp.]